MQEPVAVADRTGQVVGAVPIATAFNEGLIRLTVRVIIRHPDGRFLLQKRTNTMMTYPGYWDVAAAGHVDDGETVEDAAYRELREELGIQNISLSQRSGQFLERVHNGNPLRQYMVVFEGTYSGATSELTLQSEEVAEVAWADEVDMQTKYHPLIPDAVSALTQV